MCGIVGAIRSANHNVVDFLTEGLKRLEYRGYDSSGIAVLSEGKVKRVRRIGAQRHYRKLRSRTRPFDWAGLRIRIANRHGSHFPQRAPRIRPQWRRFVCRSAGSLQPFPRRIRHCRDGAGRCGTHGGSAHGLPAFGRIGRRRNIYRLRRFRRDCLHPQNQLFGRRRHRPAGREWFCEADGQIGQTGHPRGEKLRIVAGIIGTGRVQPFHAKGNP